MIIGSALFSVSESGGLYIVGAIWRCQHSDFIELHSGLFETSQSQDG